MNKDERDLLKMSLDTVKLSLLDLGLMSTGFGNVGMTGTADLLDNHLRTIKNEVSRLEHKLLPKE